jgi:GNAT-like C-terminal domain/N-acyltransferase N-terminal domain
VTVIATVDVRRRLSDPELPDRAVDLGFRDRDLADLLSLVNAVLHRDDNLETVARLADGVLNSIGYLDREFERRRVDLTYSDPLGTGVLPMLALLVTAPEAAAFHASRGVLGAVSTATLADLGQQVHVHRLTFGEFGLHTHWWVNLVWSGFLFRLGRLQFNLALERPDQQPEWVLSTHIPMGGPLTRTTVDESLAAASTFFAAHFPDYPTRWFHCRSWLLDPTLSELLPQSNLADFQRRWSLYGSAEPGVDDLLFFVFQRRGQVDPKSLPTDTALRRMAAERLTSGQGWDVFNGRLSQ